MAKLPVSKDGLKRAIYLVLIFGAFAVLHNFVPEGLDQAGWDGFLVLFVDVFLWLTEAVPMAITAIFVLFFGAAVNPVSISRSADMFTTYDGGGLDLTVLGCAEADPSGNVNVSKFGGRCGGPGGFVNISQNTPKVCFAFSFTSGKQDIAVENGELRIIKDGNGIKFKNNLEQTTFSSQYASETGQDVMFITERAVFRIIGGRLMLTEIAPGVDLEKDILSKMEFRPAVSENLQEMDRRLFLDKKMGL